MNGVENIKLNHHWSLTPEEPYASVTVLVKNDLTTANWESMRNQIENVFSREQIKVDVVCTTDDRKFSAFYDTNSPTTVLAY